MKHSHFSCSVYRLLFLWPSPEYWACCRQNAPKPQPHGRTAIRLAPAPAVPPRGAHSCFCHTLLFQWQVSLPPTLPINSLSSFTGLHEAVWLPPGNSKWSGEEPIMADEGDREGASTEQMGHLSGGQVIEQDKGPGVQISARPLPVRQPGASVVAGGRPSCTLRRPPCRAAVR